MTRFVLILKKIFFLPPISTLFTAVFGFSFLIVVAAVPIEIEAVKYAAYLASAYALIVSITGFSHLINFFKDLKAKALEHSVIRRFLDTKIGMLLFGSVRSRTEFFLYQGLFINILYIVMKMISGIYYRSVWFVALAFYYILLAVMRVVLLHRRKKLSNKPTMENELLRYRACGISLLLMNQALAGIVILVVRQNKGFAYPGILIYLMAAYSFYSIITAVINLVKFRKHGSPVLSAAKVINLVAAMVSILSLETAMIPQFGGGSEFRLIMTSITGGAVCTIVIGIAVIMIVKSTIQLKKLREVKSNE
ncbi:MAG: hypothetical protein NC299_17495 [Lachnospiraceae bacterium]|nr:hypothetical protein [Ruminococcus sp.]MCM1277127.1 hypothetical protein [Lachnospiraceae bacterium]